jgi:hypothetical protein
VLRTGGIHEKWSAVSASRFLLFQTVAHSHAERVRPEHRDLLADAADAAAAAAAAARSDHAIVLRASAKVVAAIAKVVAAIEVNRWEHVEEIASLHIWTADSVRTGWTFDPDTGSLCWWCRQPAGRAAAAGSHAGLRGMHQLVQLPVSPAWAEPVHDDDTLRDVADRIRQAIA